MRKGHSAGNFSVVRHIALNMLRHEETLKIGIKNKRLNAGWNNGYLLKVLDECKCIKVEDVTGKIKNRILYRLNNLSKNNLGSEVRVYTECPGHRFPEDVKKPKIELFASNLPLLMVN